MTACSWPFGPSLTFNTSRSLVSPTFKTLSQFPEIETCFEFCVRFEIPKPVRRRLRIRVVMIFICFRRSLECGDLSPLCKIPQRQQVGALHGGASNSRLTHCNAQEYVRHSMMSATS